MNENQIPRPRSSAIDLGRSDLLRSDMGMLGSFDFDVSQPQLMTPSWTNADTHERLPELDQPVLDQIDLNAARTAGVWTDGDPIDVARLEATAGSTAFE